ncbi:MAG TPA: transglycosylase domain-containing protein, partial [Armatimonadota bacterium]|nr:transglycosylase domain-containing protein [Armatimonadota bacterium]
MLRFRTFKFKLLISFVILAAAASWGIVNELHSSRLQAWYFSSVASKLKYSLESGNSPAIRFPTAGPYDVRLGYSEMPNFIQRLTTREFIVSQQARMSAALVQSELPPIYREKDQAGLRLLDSRQQSLYAPQSPRRVYADFAAIPKVLVDTLLFIEDRELLDARYPERNPAVNWSRLNRAVFDQVKHAFFSTNETPGASTLVTQIEKYRHSPEGRTLSAKEKLLQMQAASIRAYLDGEDNMASRRQAVVTYLNTVPLTAKSGYGEINGLGDGMWAWYGRDFSQINQLLKADSAISDASRLQRTAEVYKQALSLMIAQRRPSYYLREGATVLAEKTNNHLRLLAAAGIISPALEKAALSIQLHLHQGPVSEPLPSFVSRKAVNALRTDLSALLQVPHLYDLDRYDLTVHTTLDGQVQQAVTAALSRLKTPAGAKAAGLYGHDLLRPNDNPSRLAFSFTLFERGADANLLRVQTDNLDQPFDLNSGARLNLGSTAKLRTLITYLEIIADLQKRYGDMSAQNLRQVSVNPQDVLSRWALDYFATHPASTLRTTLEAAMVRTYSGDPSEKFFTGGGVQQFTNFDPTENSRSMTVREGFQHSVNLVFVRLMRDIVRYYALSASPVVQAGTVPASTELDRQALLSRFADKEGREFLARFYKKYTGKSADEVQQMVIADRRATPKRLAIVFRSLNPDQDMTHFAAFLHTQMPQAALPPQAIQHLYDAYGPDRISLVDRGYLAGIHPLELWLAGYQRHHPQATLAQMVEASRHERQEVYEWLFKSHNKKTQASRIHQMEEFDAFQKIALDWRHLGYPFQALTPSYGSALGASGDRPDSLAKLMGIIVNGGKSIPIEEIKSMQFAQGTPYETHLIHKAADGRRVLPQEVAAVVRRSLIDVVDGGTAIRLKNGWQSADGNHIEIGGKTGTGDQRFNTYTSGGKLIESRAVNRSATFVFLIG